MALKWTLPKKLRGSKNEFPTRKIGFCPLTLGEKENGPQQAETQGAKRMRTAEPPMVTVEEKTTENAPRAENQLQTRARQFATKLMYWRAYSNLIHQAPKSLSAR